MHQKHSGFLCFIFILLFLFPDFSLFAQYHFDYNERVIRAYEEIGHLKFKSGEKLLEAEKAQNPNNLAVYHVENSIDFLKILISENEDLFDELEDHKDDRIDLLEEGSKKKPYYRYAIAEINIQWAFSRLKFQEYITAFFEVRRAFRLLEENQEKFPDFMPNLVGLGFLHTLVGSVPENYRWVTDFVGIQGDMDQGIAELTQVLDSALTTEEYAHLRSQSLLFLSFIHLNLQKDLEQAEELRDLVKKHCAPPGSEKFSPIMVYIYAKLLMKTGMNDEAIELLSNYPFDDPRYYPMPYLKYMLGKAYLHKTSPKASEYLKDYIRTFDGRNFLKSACMLLSWNALLHGDMKSCLEYKEKIEDIGVTDVEPDKVAESYADDDRLPNAGILRGRMLFDGGYFEPALNELLSAQTRSSLKDHRDSLEWVYRTARVYHESGNIPMALKNYARTIDEGRNDRFYYAANAALKTAQIYESMKLYAKAMEFYEMVSEMNFDQYEGSIKQKAKAGRNRLKNKK